MTEITPKSEKDESTWTRGITAMMLAAIAMSTVVLGVVAIVAMSKSDSDGTSGASPAETVSAATIVVDIKEFSITMSPSAVRPGDVTFEIRNSGAVPHDFVITKLDIHSSLLNSGASETIVAKNVVAGTYEVICTVAGHADAGMKATFTVSADAPSAEAKGHEMAGVTPASGTAAHDEMTWQEMDAIMHETALKFPAKTEGLGNGEITPTLSDDGYKVFNLTASIIKWEVEPGKFVDGWAYNGQIPGPVIRLNVGDKVRIVLKNELPESTTLHPHGVRVPNKFDGVPPYTQDPIKPGETFTYEFTAQETTVGMYHSHHNPQVQVPNGLLGALIVGDWKDIAMKAAGTRVVDDDDGKAEQEIVMVLNDAGTIGLSLNGKSFPATTPYTMKVGESLVVHYFNEGNQMHPMHLHQTAGLVVAKDGRVLESPFWADTLSVAPGERWTMIYTALDPGVWAWHCHILPHAETATGMRYMVTAVIVSPK